MVFVGMRQRLPGLFARDCSVLRDVDRSDHGVDKVGHVVHCNLTCSNYASTYTSIICHCMHLNPCFRSISTHLYAVVISYTHDLGIPHVQHVFSPYANSPWDPRERNLFMRRSDWHLGGDTALGRNVPF